MDQQQIQPLLTAIRDHGLAPGRLRGVFHIAIGRRITTATNVVVSMGVTWRVLSEELKEAKFDRALVTELGADPETLSPRDRERFWYAAIGVARVDSAEARAQAEELARLLKPLGFIVGPAPTGAASASHPPPKPKVDDAKAKKKK